MKKIITLFLIAISISVLGQTSEQSIKFKKQILSNPNLSNVEYLDSLPGIDFSTLWTQTDNSLIYGFIGPNYQRIRVKFISVTKDTNISNTYYIIGKTMVKNNICQFNGTVKITSIRTLKNLHWGLDNEFKKKGVKKEGILIAEYHFEEDSNITHSGIFEGILTSSWYIDKKGSVKYDDIEKHSDSYCNNQFAGTWTGYNSTIKKVCNWGDYRIPFATDLDIGESEFSPNDKYLQNGWLSTRDAYKNEQARKEENRLWWK